MGLEADYEQAARELVVRHLTSDGRRPRIVREGVETGIGRTTIDFRVESMDVVAGDMTMVFWALIDGVPGLNPPRIDLDLLGGGPDAHSALMDGVHLVLESVIPVLQADHDRRSLPAGVATMTVTSMTDGLPATWDLFTGTPSIMGDDRDAVATAVDEQALAQGIIDSITDSLGELRAHWFKLFVVRTDTGELLGDMKIDGVPVGVAKTFDSPKLPPGNVGVRQFGLYRPADRKPDTDVLAALTDVGTAPTAPRRWWQRR